MNTLLIAILLLAGPSGAEDKDLHAPDSVVLRAMLDELQRTRTELKLPDSPGPYFVSYTVVDLETASVSASQGALTSSDYDRSRMLLPSARVGDYEFDSVGRANMSGDQRLTLDDNYGALRRKLWLESDTAYKASARSFRSEQAGRKNRELEKDEPASFTRESPVTWLGSVDRVALDVEAFESIARELSRAFLEYADIDRSRVHIAGANTTRYLVSTEGTIVVESIPSLEVRVSAASQADDGQHLGRSFRFAAVAGAGLDTGALKQRVHVLAKELESLMKAPVVDDYSGPILFETRAAAIVLTHSLGGELSGSSFRGGSSELVAKLGRSVLPRGYDLVDDPTMSEWGGVPLEGTYAVDAQGVVGQRVVLVKNGKLKTLLTSRTPSKEFSKSNGHGRIQMFGQAAATFSNLILTSKRGLTDAAIRKRLLKLVKAADLEFGLIVREMDGRGNPSLVYRIGLDGKEQLVRGASIEAIARRDLKEIVAAGRVAEPMSPFAEMYMDMRDHGGPGVQAIYQMGMRASVISPALLFEEIEVHKPRGSHPKPPRLSRPTVSD